MIHRETGKERSLYSAELYYKNLFEEFELSTTQFEITDSTLVFVVVSMEEKGEGCSYRNMETTIEDRYRVGRISDAYGERLNLGLVFGSFADK